MRGGLPPSEPNTARPSLPFLLISDYIARFWETKGRGESHASLPYSGWVRGSGGRVAGLRDHGYGLHMNRAHYTNAWLVFTRKKEGSPLDLGLSWDKVGREEPEERKGQGAWWALFRVHDSSTLSPSPSAFLPPLPTVTEEGPRGARSWASAGMEKGRDPLWVT